MATPVEATKVELTDEQKREGIAQLPKKIQDSILQFWKDAEVHNANVRLVQAAADSKTDPNKLLAEIRDSNPQDDPSLGALLKRIAKLDETREKLISEANEIAKQYLPEAANDAEVDKAREDSKESSVILRARVKVFKDMGEMLDEDYIQYLPELKSTRGIKTGTTDTTGGTGIRPSYRKIQILDTEIVKDENGNDVEVVTPENIGSEVVKDGVTTFKSTTTMLAQVLSKRVKGETITSGEITTQFLEYLKSIDRTYDKLTSGEEFVWTFNKDVHNSDGEKIDTKSWTLKFVK
jgi:predicted RNA-binding protein